MALLNQKLKAATLVEALMALVIVMICFVIGSMIYVNVINSDNNRQEIKANLILNETALKTKEEKKFIDEKIEIGNENLIIQKTVILYKNIENLNLLTLIASDKKGRVIAQRKELIAIQ